MFKTSDTRIVPNPVGFPDAVAIEVYTVLIVADTVAIIYPHCSAIAKARPINVKERSFARFDVLGVLSLPEYSQATKTLILFP